MNAIITYFIGVSREEEQFVKISCVISQETLDKLLDQDAPKFIKIIVNDGELMFLQTDNINNIQQEF